MKRRFFCAALVSLVWIAQAADEKQFSSATNQLSLNVVVSEVLSNNPALRAASARWEAMLTRVPQASAWDDPRVGLDVERHGTTHFDTYTDNEWMVAQTVPVTGKNRLHAKAASAEAVATFAELRRKELDLTARARTAYFRLANAYEQLELNRQNEILLKQIFELSRDKYEVGTRNQADVFVAESDLAKNQEVRVDLERRLSDEQSGLNVLMNRSPQAPLAAPASLKFSHADFDLINAQQVALANRPELLNAQKKIESAQNLQTLAKRNWIPDPEFRIEARQFNGSGKGFGEYDTGIFFNFPWFNRGKYKGAIQEAKKNQESAEQDLAALQTETLGLVRDQLKKIETLHHHYQLFRDKLVPLARQSIKSHRISYEANKAGFLEFITAQRATQDVESMQLQHLADYQIALAELEMITGVSLEQLATKPTETSVKKK